MRWRWLVFAAIAAVYTAAAVFTIGVTGHRVRPLYEGIGPALPYRWVRPPSAFKASNIKPLSVSFNLVVSAKGSAAAGGTTPDTQLTLSLAQGTFPEQGSATEITMMIDPLDPGKLGALPSGYYSDGNSYRITGVYEPGGAPVPAAAFPIDVIVATPAVSVGMLFSTDGKQWQKINDHHIPHMASVATTITDSGYLLAVANHVIVPPAPSGSSQIIFIVLLAAVAVLPLSAAFLVPRLRRRRMPSRK